MRALRFTSSRVHVPFRDLIHVAHNGQSLAVGAGMVTPIDTTQPYRNVKLLDSLGTSTGYDITKPTASTLSLTPLTALMRPSGGSGTYPQNISGEDTSVSFCNELTRLMMLFGWSMPRFAASATGVSGAPYAVVGRGGSGNAYNALLYEARAFKNLNSPRTFGVGHLLWAQGEADATATPQATYLADIQGYFSGAQTDFAGIVAQAAGRQIPMIGQQHHSFPGIGQGLGVNGVNNAYIQAALANVLAPFVAIYQYAYFSDRTHLSDYRPLGEKKAEIALAYELSLLGLLPAWQSLAPTTFARNGTTVTVGYQVPWSPFALGPTALVFDTTTLGQPHGSSTPFSMFQNAMGYEAWDNVLAVSSVTNASPIAVTFTTAHGLSNGAQLYLIGIGGCTAANGIFTVTVQNSTTVTLNGTTGNGAYTSGGVARVPIGITGASVSGSQVTLTLARLPTTASWLLCYAETPDLTTYGSSAAGPPDGRFGCLRDQDPYVGPTGFHNYNWAPYFQQAMT